MSGGRRALAFALALPFLSSWALGNGRRVDFYGTVFRRKSSENMEQNRVYGGLFSILKPVYACLKRNYCNLGEEMEKDAFFI